MKPERRIASKAQAEAGLDNVKTMTPLRVAQAIEALGGGGGGVPPGYINGLQLSNAADVNNDITIGTGVAMDSSGLEILELAASLTKQLDAAWAAGSAAGGLFSGAKANSTWYHVFLIQRDVDGVIDAGFDTSVSAANIPAGYTAYRRIGSIRTDGSGNIFQFSQNGDEFLWLTPKADVEVTNLGTSATLYTLTVPIGVRTTAMIAFAVLKSAATPGVYITTTDQTSEAASVLTPLRSTIRSVSGSVLSIATMRIRSDASANVRAVSTEAGTTLAITTSGYIDQRGKQ